MTDEPMGDLAAALTEPLTDAERRALVAKGCDPTVARPFSIVPPYAGRMGIDSPYDFDRE